MLKLANRNLGIMSGTLPKFVDVHEKIIQIKFDDNLAGEELRDLALRPKNVAI